MRWSFCGRLLQLRLSLQSCSSFVSFYAKISKLFFSLCLLLQIYSHIHTAKMDTHRSTDIVHLTEDGLKVLVGEQIPFRVNTGSVQNRFNHVVLNLSNVLLATKCPIFPTSWSIRTPAAMFNDFTNSQNWCRCTHPSLFKSHMSKTNCSFSFNDPCVNLRNTSKNSWNVTTVSFCSSRAMHANMRCTNKSPARIPNASANSAFVSVMFMICSEASVLYCEEWSLNWGTLNARE